jgi:thioredoxin 1
VTSADGIVLLDFWAAWCGPCKMFKPVFEKAAENHTDITFGSIDTEAEQALSGSLGISSIPTIMAFRDGIPLMSQPGALRAADLEKLISAIRELDMTEVRAKYDKMVAEH